jgi:hypothetical protein
MSELNDDSDALNDSRDTNDGEGRPKMFRHLRRRHIFLGGLVLFLLVVAFGSWLAVRSFEAKSNLEAARTSAQQAKDALLQGDTDSAANSAGEAQSRAQQARDATHSIPWSIISAVPWLGDPFTTGQEISNVVLGLAADVLQPAATVGAVLAPDQLLQGNRIDVQALRERESELSALAASAAKLNDNARAIPDPKFVSVLFDARSQLQQQTANVASLLENTTLAARLAPSMMGADGPRTYFMGFQTNAEARGTGGLLGGFGLLRFDNGTATVDALASNRDLDGAKATVDLGPEFTETYGFTNPLTDFRNSNLSSHFPYAAQIWKSMWAEQTGTNVDGVIVLDPVTLSYILGAVGPVRMPDGEVITKDNVVELTESTAYARFPTDQTARKMYLQDIASEVVRKITGRIESPQKLLDALGKAIGERRIAVWSSVPAEQEILEHTPLAHTVPDDPAPYAGVVINNLGGNKLDYYLRRQIEYVADGCTGETRNSTVTIRLANEAPKTGLPDYVAAAPGIREDIPLDVPKGAMVTSVRLLATTGATLVSALVDGQQVPVFSGTERGHPTFEVQLGIPPGESGELSFRLSEPTSAGPARVPVQPLLDSVKPKVSVPHCSN